MTYQTSTENKAIEIVNIKSLEGKVKESMESAGNKGAFGYIRGGAEDEWTMD
ncbi:MAG: lactate oxidase, partial [Lactococcus lactis]|nr:lactate oxidase [Lactococcus lactis]